MPPYELYTDGGCDPNPGPASAAGVCIDPATGAVVFAYADYLGDGTNNIGELTAILNGLKKAKERNLSHLTVLSDSSLSVDLCTHKKQTTKPHLATLVERIHRHAASGFVSLTFQWVPAHSNHLYNETADQLCSHMLRTAAGLSRGRALPAARAMPAARPPEAVRISSATRATPETKKIKQIHLKEKHTPIEAFFESAPSPKPGRLRLNCPFQEKDQVKALGAKWNPEEKKWVVADTRENRATFEKWLKD